MELTEENFLLMMRRLDEVHKLLGVIRNKQQEQKRVLERIISYNDYLCANLDNTVSYAEYLAAHIDRIYATFDFELGEVNTLEESLDD
jgi:hypothetical protein